MRFGVGEHEKIWGHKRTVKKEEKKEGGSQLVDVFISMDSGGVFIFAFASEEDQEEEAAEEEETEQGATHSNQARLIRSESIIICIIAIIIIVSVIVVISTVVIIRIIIIHTVIIVSSMIRKNDETVTV